MDVLSLIGIIMAFVAIIGGNYLEGGHLGALANGPAALIVIGGTVGAALLQSPMSSFKRAMQILIWIIFPPRVDLPGGIDRVVNWSLTARKEGLLGLEGVADAARQVHARREDDPHQNLHGALERAQRRLQQRRAHRAANHDQRRRAIGQGAKVAAFEVVAADNRDKRHGDANQAQDIHQRQASTRCLPMSSRL